MSHVHVDVDKLDQLADVVSAKSGVPLKLTIDGMVEAILGIEEGITPTGTKNISSNGEHDVTEFAMAQVDVQPRLQSKTIHPSTTEQTVAADAGFDGLSGVTVDAIPAQYVDTSDANAVAADLALGKTAYSGGVKLTGTLAPVDVEPLSVAENGTYTAPTGMAYSPVTVSVSGGGGGGSMSDPVRFFDYDGALVYSYSADEFLALDTMPENPDHTDIGLTAQGWNWSLADAQEYVEKYGALNVGQMYIPTDGKTHLWIHIGDHETGSALTMTVRYTQTVSQGVTVDWGDGTAPQTYTGTSVANRTHTYAAPGDYEITLNVTSGTVSFEGTASSSGYAIYGDKGSKFGKFRIKRAWFGSGVTSIGASAFYNCYPLTSVIIPVGVTRIGVYAFYHCYSLMSVIIPDGVTSIGQYTFDSCYSLTSVIIPDGVASIYQYAFHFCYSLTSVIIPDGVTNIYPHLFDSCYSLPSVTIPDGVTSIGENALYYCYPLTSVIIPVGVTSIGASAFHYCQSLAKIHLRPTTPPTLSNTNTFNGMAADCTMYVPYSADHSVLAAYQAATNWSTYASYMVEEPQE